MRRAGENVKGLCHSLYNNLNDVIRVFRLSHEDKMLKRCAPFVEVRIQAGGEGLLKDPFF